MSIASERSHMALRPERYVLCRGSYKHQAPTEPFLVSFHRRLGYSSAYSYLRALKGSTFVARRAGT